MTRCLLVDEDQQERSALGRLLGEYGFEMTESGTADAALQHCRKFTPDVIVTAERLGWEWVLEAALRTGRYVHAP